MSKNQLITVEKVPFLTPEEVDSINDYREKDGTLLPPSTSDKMFNLFAAGRSVTEMSRINPIYSVPQILLSRVYYKWDERLTEYNDKQAEILFERLKASRIQAAHLVLDKIQVAHLESKRQTEMYLQNPIAANLPIDRIKDSADFKVLVETINAIMKMGNIQSEVQSAAQTNININTGGSQSKKKTAQIVDDDTLELILDDRHLDVLKLIGKSKN